MNAEMIPLEARDPSDTVRTVGLVKRFRKDEALRGLDMFVPTGSVYGFIGPNGAGKTTTLKILLNILRPTEGGAYVFGCDTQREEVAIKQRVGYLSERRSLPDFLTGVELLDCLKRMYPKWNDARVKKYVEMFKIPMNKKISSLSLGERTKLGLTAAVVREPDLLILDEPTNGMDPIARELFFSALADDFGAGDKTVIIASHILPEIERVCDSVGIISEGKLALQGSLDELKDEYKMISFKAEGGDGLKDIREVLRTEKQEELTVVYTRGDPQKVLSEVRKLSPAYVDVKDLSLKDIFLLSVGA